MTDIQFLADENFNNDILRGVWRRISDAKFTRVQDTVLAGADDPNILAYATEHDYIVITHDIKTMPPYFYERIKAGLPVSGMFIVHKLTPIGQVVDALELIILASEQSDWFGKITYVPFD